MKIINPEKFQRLPDGFLFDTDNTLYPYEPAHNFAWSETKIKISKTFSLEEKKIESIFNEAKKQIKQSLGQTASSHNRLLYIQRMLELLGMGSQVLLALDFEQTYWRSFFTKIILFDNVIEFLDDIRLLKIPTAIVTDLTAQIQFRKIVYLNLENYFDYIVTSEEAGFDKPNLAPFNLVVDKLRLENKSIWMIGDNPENDIKGAKLGINAITLQKIHAGVKKGTKESTPDLFFENYSDLRNFVKNIIKTNV